MRRLFGLLGLGAILSLNLLGAQEPRQFCVPGGRETCVPDTFQVVFPPEGSAVDDGSPDVSSIEAAAGGTVIARVVFIAESELIQGWSLAVKHDPAFLTIRADEANGNLQDAAGNLSGTKGTVADPSHPSGVAIQPMFDVTQAVREADDTPTEGPFIGYFSAIVLSFIADTQLPLGRQSVCNSTYTVAATPPAGGTKLEFVNNELAAPNSPPVAINITANGSAVLPTTLIDAVVLPAGGPGEEICDNGTDDDGDGQVDCHDPDCTGDPACPVVEDCDNGTDDDGDGQIDCADPDCAEDPACLEEDCDNGTDDDGDGQIDCDDPDCAGDPACPAPECPNWAFYFGPAAAEAAFPVAGDAENFPVSMRNTGEAFAFSLGVKRDGESWSFSGALGTDNTRLVELIVTDADGATQTPATPNTATVAGGREPTALSRGSALTAFDPGDFFAYDLAPGVGGPGFTAGYVSDLDSDTNKIPATTGDGCPVQEILLVEFGVVRRNFSRGDADGNGKINVTDAVLIIQVTLGNLAARFDCDDALDANDDGQANISDALPVLAWIFQQGPRLPEPFLACGQDSGTSAGCNQDSPFCAP